jgi:hypothetical protein
MNNIDEELRRALARREPPGEFTSRVLAAVVESNRASESPALWSWISRFFFGRWMAVAATTLIIGGGIAYQQHERELQGEAAKEKLLRAMQIAGTKLHDTQQVLSGGVR